jgi:hypothetical protein
MGGWFRTTALSICLVVLLIVVEAALFRPSSPSSLAAKFQRLHKGMTEAEVEAVMAKPQIEIASTDEAVCIWYWKGSEGRVKVGFLEGNLYTAYCGTLETKDGRQLELPEKPPPDLTFTKFRRWIKF